MYYKIKNTLYQSNNHYLGRGKTKANYITLQLLISMSANFRQRQSGIRQTPATGDIFSVGVPNPGVGVAPGGRIPLSGPNLSYVNWNAGPGGTNVMPAIGFGPDGLPRGQTTVREFMSNTFVQQQYFINKYRNKADLAIIEGQIVLVHRSTPKKPRFKAPQRYQHIDFRAYTIINLPHFNGLLDRAHNRLHALADQYDNQTRRVKETEDASRLRQLLQKHSEDEITEYIRTRRDPARAEKFTASEIDPDGELAELYELAHKGNFCYAICPALIMAEFSVLGVVQNLSRSTSMEGINNPSRRDDVLIGNIIISKRAEMHNVFQPHTEVDSGSRLFLVLMRKRLAHGRAGAFVMAPIACKYNDAPTLAHRRYRDPAGYLGTGLVRKFGYVQLPGDRFPNPARQQVASGVRPPTNMEQPKRATAITPKIQVQFDMQ